MLLGIDIGGTKVAYTLARDDGEIVARHREATPSTGSARSDVERMLGAARTLLLDQGEATPTAVGLAVPGPLDLTRGLVVNPPNLVGWEEVPLTAWVEAEFGCAVRMENDANAGALAEWQYGAGQGARDLVYLTMSTGVGAGLIVGGRLHRGPRGSAGEVGHVPVQWPGEPCACGLTGCLEAYVGGRAWAEHLRGEAHADGRVWALAGGRDRIGPEHVVAAAREEDPWALAQFARFNEYLGRALVQLTFTLAPEVVVLGTIVAAAGEALCLDPLRAYVAEHVWPHQAPDLRIEAARLREDLPHRSAVAVALGLGGED